MKIRKANRPSNTGSPIPKPTPRLKLLKEQAEGKKKQEEDEEEDQEPEHNDQSIKQGDEKDGTLSLFSSFFPFSSIETDSRN